jgi:hypothetical protein
MKGDVIGMLNNKKSLLCLTIVLAMLFCYIPTAFGASSISPWAEKEVREAIDLGLIPADMQKDYTKNITRAEFCRLTVVLLENIYETTIEDILSQRGLTPDKAVFTDTHDPDILAANALGIVFGDGKGIFNPHGEIKRGEAAAMLMRTASLTGEYHALPHVFDDAVMVSCMGERISLCSLCLRHHGRRQHEQVSSGQFLYPPGDICYYSQTI